MPTRRLAEIAFLIVVPLALFLLLSEIFLRVYLRSHMFYDVEMSRYAVSLKLDSPNPLIGHHHRPDAEARLMGVVLRTNSDGFRDDDYPIERGEKRRIVFLGDSLTLGWGVDKEETFEHRLEQELDRRAPTEIINLGVGNYNTTQELNLFIDKGLEYQPDQVVLFYFINDAEPLPRASRFPGLGRYRIVTFYWSRINALRSRIADVPGYETFYSELYAEGSEGWQRSKQSLRDLQQLARAEGFDFRVVLLPELHELDPYGFASEHELVLDFLRELGVPALDLAPAFRDQREPQRLWVSFDDAHPNALGHRLIADYTLAFLMEGAR